jgi:hypothetical protein
MLAAGLIVAGVAFGPVTAPAQPATPVDAHAEARATLTRMTGLLGSAQTFSVTIDSNYDAVQDTGQKVEFGAVRRILLSRPNSLRIETEDRDGSHRRLYFDGKALTLFSPGAKIYASVAHPGSVDQVVQYLIDELQTPVPLSMLLLTTLPQHMEQRVSEIGTVAEEKLDGREAVHLAARSDDADLQVWVAKGEQPVPLRVVITYKDAEGEPQFRATLRDWNFNPRVDASAFIFAPPPDALAVAFMVPAPPPPAPASTPKSTRK